MTRRLTPDERQLWEQVAASVKPRHSRRASAKPVQAAPVAQVRAKPAKRQSGVIKPVGAKEAPTRHVKPASPFAPPALDGKRTGRFRKGELPIEARIDLHGMTLDLAHRALVGFLVQARDRGQRMVLVITGKGPPEGGALKRLVPMWLATPPLAATIAAAAQAQAHHGGSGALYIYLRRKRA
jgi:DNA-nicking Smr family endonuclease